MTRLTLSNSIRAAKFISSWPGKSLLQRTQPANQASWPPTPWTAMDMHSLTPTAIRQWINHFVAFNDVKFDCSRTNEAECLSNCEPTADTTTQELVYIQWNLSTAKSNVQCLRYVQYQWILWNPRNFVRCSFWCSCIGRWGTLLDIFEFLFYCKYICRFIDFGSKKY